ncbi:hypothetical protein Pfra02_04430 [Pseudomonas fragi]|nr:hypothetical protein Pfra02_04430 [Pseudomonas fragi]
MEDTYRSQFRLPYSLYESLKISASSNRRSLNAELVARLEESFGAQGSDADRLQRAGMPGGMASPLIESLVAQIEAEIRRQAKELAEGRTGSK